jgi:shikimate kinase
MPLPQVLATYGDEAFLAAEESLVLALPDDTQDTVISTGGSMVYCTQAMQHLQRISTIAYLVVPLSTIQERIGNEPRGIVGLGTKTLDEVFAERITLYEAYADVRIASDQSDTSVVESMVVHLESGPDDAMLSR